jgi:hypothetical protein
MHLVFYSPPTKSGFSATEILLQMSGRSSTAHLQIIHSVPHTTENQLIFTKYSFNFAVEHAEATAMACGMDSQAFKPLKGETMGLKLHQNMSQQLLFLLSLQLRAKRKMRRLNAQI